MKPAVIVGILLIALGVLALGYQSISYTKREKIVDIGPIEATAETKKRVPIPPILGAASVVGGIILIITGARKP